MASTPAISNSIAGAILHAVRLHLESLPAYKLLTTTLAIAGGLACSCSSVNAHSEKRLKCAAMTAEQTARTFFEAGARSDWAEVAKFRFWIPDLFRDVGP